MKVTPKLPLAQGQKNTCFRGWKGPSGTTLDYPNILILLCRNLGVTHQVPGSAARILEHLPS